MLLPANSLLLTKNGDYTNIICSMNKQS